MLEDNYNRQREHKRHIELNKDNVKTHNTLAMIEGKDPKYAKHLLLRDDLVMKFALKVGGGVELLNQPMCPRCEIPGAWNTGASGYCFRCGTSVPANKVVTVRDYLLEHTKGMKMEDLENLNMLGGVRI